MINTDPVDFIQARQIAEQNGHKLGHIFNDKICFCQICDAPMTFKSHGSSHHPDYFSIFIVNGLYGSKCNGR